MVKLIIIDNLDSFTYNLVELIRNSGEVDYTVVRNGDYIDGMGDSYEKILFSPGPGLPSEYPLMTSLLDHYGKTKSILGICLGHQSIAEYFGGSIYNLNPVVHGKDGILKIQRHSESIFEGVRDLCPVGLYHSWAVEKKDFPACLEITAESDEGLIMGISHKSYDIKGLQFHPESFISTEGKKMIENWLKF